MKVECTWKDKLSFDAKAEQHSLIMDAKQPLGSDLGPTPKQLILMAICGCTGMDVVSLMRKYREPLTGCEIDAEADVVSGHPAIFKAVNLRFRFTGEIKPELAIEAVHLSQTKYCSVSAMVSKAVSINYVIELNGIEINKGTAAFA